MGISLWGLLRLALFSGLVGFILMVLAGALIYFGMLWWVSRDVIQSGVETLRRKFLKPRKLVPVEAASDD
jgi:hypothetical protein